MRVRVVHANCCGGYAARVYRARASDRRQSGRTLGTSTTTTPTLDVRPQAHAPSKCYLCESILMAIHCSPLGMAAGRQARRLLNAGVGRGVVWGSGSQNAMSLSYLHWARGASVNAKKLCIFTHVYVSGSVCASAVQFCGDVYLFDCCLCFLSVCARCWSAARVRRSVCTQPFSQLHTVGDTSKFNSIVE